MYKVVTILLMVFAAACYGQSESPGVIFEGAEDSDEEMSVEFDCTVATFEHIDFKHSASPGIILEVRCEPPCACGCWKENPGECPPLERVIVRVLNPDMVTIDTPTKLEGDGTTWVEEELDPDELNIHWDSDLTDDASKTLTWEKPFTMSTSIDGYLNSLDPVFADYDGWGGVEIVLGWKKGAIGVSMKDYLGVEGGEWWTATYPVIVDDEDYIVYDAVEDIGWWADGRLTMEGFLK
jgi:hypothetical protein